MENSKRDKEVNDQHPKPSEEIQLDIETVTPDTEKDGLPNDQKNQSSGKSAEEVPVEEIGEESNQVDSKDDGAPDIETVSP